MVTPLIPEVMMKCSTRSNSQGVESSKIPKVSYGLIFDTWGSHGMDTPLVENLNMPIPLALKALAHV